MNYPKINSIFKRWRKDLDLELPEGVRYGDFKYGEFASPELEYLASNQWIWSEKFDGTNIKIVISDTGTISMEGKTSSPQVPKDLHRWIANWVDVNRSNILNQFPEGAILYGEGVGVKIQSGGLYGPQHFKLFDVLVGSFWLEKSAVKSIADTLNLDSPDTWIGTVKDAIDRVITKPKSVFGDFVIEGYVGQPVVRLADAKGNRICTKIKVVDFDRPSYFDTEFHMVYTSLGSPAGRYYDFKEAVRNMPEGGFVRPAKTTIYGGV